MHTRAPSTHAPGWEHSVVAASNPSAFDGVKVASWPGIPGQHRARRGSNWGESKRAALHRWRCSMQHPGLTMPQGPTRSRSIAEVIIAAPYEYGISREFWTVATEISMIRPTQREMCSYRVRTWDHGDL